MANLAYLYYAVGRLEEAGVLLRQTAARCESALPPGHPLTQAVRQGLANLAKS